VAIRRRSWLLVVAVPAVLIAVGLFANHPTKRPSTCTPPNGVEVHRFPDDLPGSVRQALRKLGPIAAPDEKFCETDVCHDLPFSRVAFVWSRQTRWILPIEHGGRGYAIEIYAYDLADDGSVIMTTNVKPKDDAVCAEAYELTTLPQ
jgi:hypothetical protein